MNRKKLVKGFYCLCFGSLFAFLLSCNIEPSETEQLQQSLKTVNDKCPQMIDAETRLDAVLFQAPSTIIYKYTLVNLERKNVDTAEFRKALWPGILSGVKVSDAMKPFRDNLITIEYHYSDKSNQIIYNFRASPQEYKP